MPRLTNNVPLIICIFSFLLTLATTNYVKNKQLELKKTSFNHRIEANTTAIKNQISSELRTVEAAASFYQALSGNLKTQFPLFAAEIIEQSESLVGLQWMEKIYPADIPALNRRMRDHYPDFNIYTVPKDQPKQLGYVFADQRPVYIATNIYPVNPMNESILGFYSSRKRFELVLNDISVSGKANISDPVRLIQHGLNPTAKKDGLLAYYPVFTADKKNLKGVLIGAVRMEEYFRDLLLHSPEQDHIPMQIIDTGYDSEDQSIMFTSAQWQVNTGRIFTKQIELQNRTWNINYKFDESINKTDLIILLVVLAIGLVISSLLALITHILHKQNKHIAKQLSERTKELQAMVNHDSLTGLKNRRAFNNILYTKASRNDHFSLISFDIDKFKTINDTYGHLCGDAVLQDLAEQINASLPEKAYSFRLGGDEFCILAPLTKTQLPQYLRTLQQAIQANPCQFNQQGIVYTLSIGAAMWPTRQAQTAFSNESELKQQIENLQHSADNALYASKNRGRNNFTLVD